MSAEVHSSKVGCVCEKPRKKQTKSKHLCEKYTASKNLVLQSIITNYVKIITFL